MRELGLAILPIALLFIASGARAQEADHSDRGDVSDFRDHEDEDGLPEPYEYGLDGMVEPSWSFDIASPILLDTNPFWAADGSHDALLVTPSLSVTYSHPQLVSGWDLELSGGADADIYSRDPEELNEARLDATARAFHRLGNAGTLSFGFRARWSYVGEDFSVFDHAQQRYTVTFASSLSDDIRTAVSAEYRDASDAAQRRFLGTVNFDWTMLANDDVRLGFFQEFAASSFTAGTNDGRDDLLSLSELSLTPVLDLPEGVRLGVTAALFHRISNREASRFTALQVAARLGVGF